jgi:hypothetical protein
MELIERTIEMTPGDHFDRAIFLVGKMVARLKALGYIVVT